MEVLIDQKELEHLRSEVMRLTAANEAMRSVIHKATITASSLKTEIEVLKLILSK